MMSLVLGSKPCDCIPHSVFCIGIHKLLRTLIDTIPCVLLT